MTHETPKPPPGKWLIRPDVVKRQFEKAQPIRMQRAREVVENMLSDALFIAKMDPMMRRNMPIATKMSDGEKVMVEFGKRVTVEIPPTEAGERVAEVFEGMIEASHSTYKDLTDHHAEDPPIKYDFSYTAFKKLCAYAAKEKAKRPISTPNTPS